MAQAKGAAAPAKAADDQAPVDQAPVDRVTVIAMITITDGANSTPPGKEVMLSAEDAARLLKRGHVKSIVPEQSEEQPEAPATEGDQ